MTYHAFGGGAPQEKGRGKFRGGDEYSDIDKREPFIPFKPIRKTGDWEAASKRGKTIRARRMSLVPYKKPEKVLYQRSGSRNQEIRKKGTTTPPCTHKDSISSRTNEEKTTSGAALAEGRDHPSK